MTFLGHMVFRHEGTMMNAYFIVGESEIHMGSIVMAAVIADETRLKAFSDLLTDFMGDVIADSTDGTGRIQVVEGRVQ